LRLEKNNKSKNRSQRKVDKMEGVFEIFGEKEIFIALESFS